MKWLFRSLMFAILVFIALPSGNASAIAFNGVSSSDGTYYYYNGGICYYWGYNTESSSTYEHGWGYWTDAYPQLDTVTMYNNQDVRNDRVMGTTADMGFTATGAYWIGSRFAGNDGAPWNVVYQRKAGTNYKRAKTTPAFNNIAISGANYVNGNDYWIRPSTTLAVNVGGKQDYAGNKIQLDDWISMNYLRLYGSGLDMRADIHDNGILDIFAPVGEIPVTYGTKSSISKGYTTFNTTFNVKPTGNNRDLSVMTYFHSANGKSTADYNDTGKNIRTDGDEPTYSSSSLTSAIYQNGNTYWTKPNDTVYINLRQYDGRSGNEFSYLRLYDSGTDVKSQHDFDQVSTHNNAFLTDPDVAISAVSRTENTGGYGTVQYTVVPKTSGQTYDVSYYFVDNVGNTPSTYTSTGKTLGVDGVAPSVGFRNSADTADFTSRGWSGSPIDVRLEFADSLSGYKQSHYAWSTSTTTPTTWSAWSTNTSTTTSKSGNGQWYLHVQAQDNVGNTITTYKGPYNFNSTPVANFSFSPSTIYNNTTVSFTNSSTDADGDVLTNQWAYQAPGSTTWVNFSTLEDPTRVFNVLGDYDVRLTVSDGIASNSISKVIKVSNRNPVANFSFSPTTIYNDTTVTFTGSSTDADGDVLTYQWAYQTPGSTTWVNFSTLKSPTKVFNIKGTWDIRLTVTDEAGATNAITKSPIVSNRAPNADFTFSPTTIYNDTTVTFTNTSTDADGDVLTYQWAYQTPGSTTWVNFSTLKSPTKVLNIKGTWDIRLTVTDEDGATDSITKNPIVSNRAPNADFTFSPTTIYNDTTVTFTNTSTDADGDVLTYQWAYQTPGSTTWVNFSTLKSPTKVLNIKGTWDIRLTVTDEDGATDSITKNPIVSNRNPVANFSFSPTTIYNDTTVTFTNTSTDADGDVLTYQWAYQTPGSTTWVNFSTVKSPTKVLNIKGTWNIRLTVTDEDGATDSVSSLLTVLNRNPVASFSFSPATIYNNTTVTFTNISSDLDGDALTYSWQYQTPGSSTWVTFSTSKDNTKILNIKGNWNIRLTVSDGTISNSITKVLTVSNRNPIVSLTYSPTVIYEGDTVTLSALVNDLDLDSLTVIFEQNINGIWTQLKQQANVLSGQTVTYSMNVGIQNYSIRARVIDTDNASGSASVAFTPNRLEIEGFVEHTSDWGTIHTQKNHPADYFYSGETFMLAAQATDHQIENVVVDFKGFQQDGGELSISKYLTLTQSLYLGEIYDTKMIDPTTKLVNGNVYFMFTAKWQNGIIKQHLVTVQIIDSLYGAFDFHKTN